MMFSFVRLQKQAQITAILDLLERIVGAMFMRVNSKCAHQVRPPQGGKHRDRSGVDKLFASYR